MVYSRPKQFTLSVDAEIVKKYGLRDKHNDETIEVKSPYKNISLTAVFDKLIDAYSFALSRNAEDKYLYCSFTSVMKHNLEDAIALLAQIAENQNNAIAALNGSQGSSMPTHSMELLNNVYDKLRDKNILWLYKTERFDILQFYGHFGRLLELKPDAEIPSAFK